MNLKLRFKDLSLMYIYLFVGIIILINAFYVNSYYQEYGILCISYFFVVGLFVFMSIKYKVELDHPYILISILYIMIFTITPIVLISIGRTDSCGVDVMGGSIKTTCIYMISYFAFTIGYFSKYVPIKYETNKKKLSCSENKRLIKISLLLWSIGFIICLYVLLSSGKSLMYILTVGAKGDVQTNDNNSLGAISNFQYFMIIPLIYIIFYSKSKFLKVTILFFTIIAFLASGFRFIIFIIIISIAIFYFRYNKKKPNFFVCLIIGIGLMVMITVIGYMRSDLRSGNDIDWSNLNIDTVWFSLESNFNIYQPVYGIVEKYPKEYPYTFGKSMFLETITMFVPRMIWSDKPLAINSTTSLAIRRGISDDAILKAYMAMPNLGEYYVEFGILGCIILMFVFGRIYKWTIKLMYSKSYHDLALYSILLPMALQLVTRGNTPGSFYFVIFMILPSFIIRFSIKNN